MNGLRRGAMQKMGRLALGALGAASNTGRGHAAYAPLPEPTPYLGGALTGLGEAADYATASGDPNWNSPTEYHPRPEEIAAKRQMEARYQTAMPLREKLDALYGRGGRQTLTHCRGLHQNTTDLPALRSVAPWWKDHVAMERRKKLQSAVKTIEAEIQKLMSDPLEALDTTLRESVAAFLAEMSKP